MNENDIDVDNPEFIKDIGFLIEVVKSTIYQRHGETSYATDGRVVC